jgi:hypothetical protein
VAEPAAEKARRALLAACAPFGVDDPAMAADMVRHQAQLAATAHLQRQLEEAEAEEKSLREEVEVLLAQTGIDGPDVATRVAALQEAVAGARRRDQARGKGRSREEVEAELGKLEAHARRMHRPEWGTAIAPSDAEEPDVQELLRRRQVAAQAYETAETLVPDVEHLADRKAAVERRVSVLESSLEAAPSAGIGVDTEEVQRQLLARLAAARRPGGDEVLPVILDETLVRVRGERKWELLDLVERLADKTQILYLTDDHDVVLWARRRSASDSLALLEPVAETV